MASATALSRVQYVGKDFDTFYAEIVQEVEDNFGNDANDLIESSLGIMFIDLVSFGLDTLAFYLDLQAGEVYLPTALLDDSVVKIARQLGFQVSGVVPAASDVDFTIPLAVGYDIPISEGFQFTGGAYIWETVQRIVLLAGAISVQFTVREGVTIDERFVSDGTKNQVFLLNQLPDGMVVSEGLVEVFADNEQWEVVDSLDFRNEKIVEVQPRTVPPRILFGDATSGRVPASGAEIRVKYFASSGERGNEVASGAINKEVIPLVVNGQAVTFAITNPSKPTGGSPGPTIEQIKRLAPEVFRSQDSAVTTRDIVALSEAFSDPSFGAIQKASAISVRDASADATLGGYLEDIDQAVADNVYASELATLTSIQQIFGGTERDDALVALADIDSFVVLQDPDFATALEQEDAFAAVFSVILRDVGIDVSGPLGAINAVANTTLASQAPSALVRQQIGVGTSATDDSFQSTLALSAGTQIVPGTVKVYENGTAFPGSGTQRAADDSAGGITGSNVTGSVDYETGEIIVTEAVDLWTTGDVCNVDYKSQGTDQAAVLNATAQIRSLVTVMQTNIGGEVGNGNAIVVGLVSLLETMRERGSVEIIDSTEVVRQIFNTLSSTYQTDFEEAIDDIVTGTTGVNTALTTARVGIFNYVDSILSGDCKANVVQVAILTLDENGFYAGATIGLTSALETYLNARKEPTATIKVVSGDEFLVGGEVLVRIAVSDLLVVEDVRANVEEAVDGILRGRDYDDDLRVSAVFTAVTGVSGVLYAHVEILGPIANVNADGDLIVPAQYVITKDTVTVVVIEE